MLRLFDDIVIVLATRLSVILIYTFSQVVLRRRLLASHIPTREPMLLGARIKLVRKPLARVAYKYVPFYV